MQPSRNTQWNRIRLTQTAGEAGVLTSSGSRSTLGCCGKCSLQGGNSFHKLGLCPKNTNASHLHLRCSSRPSKSGLALLFHLHSNCTRHTSHQHLRQVSTSTAESLWDGPKGQGPETLSAWLSKAPGKKALHAWERAGRLSFTQKQLCFCICDAS